MEYEFYPDVFWVRNFAMDALVLLLVRRFRRQGGKIRRIFFSAGFGAAASVLLFLWLPGFAWYQFCIHAVVNPMMVFFSFREKSLKSFGTDVLLAYVLTMLLGGFLSYGMETLGQWHYFWIWAAGGFGIGTLLLHGLLRRKEKQQTYEILLISNQQKLSLVGFLDTGNLLTDPMVHQPVHIIQECLLKEVLEKEGLLVRYIPFHSLGQEQGLLPVVTLKAMYVKGMGEKGEGSLSYIEKPVFGLAKEKLFRSRNYQVILNAKCNLG